MCSLVKSIRIDALLDKKVPGNLADVGFEGGFGVGGGFERFAVVENFGEVAVEFLCEFFEVAQVVHVEF